MMDLDYPEKHLSVHGPTGSDGAVSASQPSKLSQSSPLLRLPREIRDTIIGELFFPGEKEPVEFDQNRLGLATTAVRQITPYDRDSDKKPKFETAILRTCRQLQVEGEVILYGKSSWNLMYQDWDDYTKLSYEFFEHLPKRLRRLIRRVERKCYSEPYRMTITLYDWKLFMTFLARECPNLRSLKLWGPGDRYEGPQWVRTCQKDAEWVKAILQIKTLQEFDMPVIQGGLIYNCPDFKDDFLPWLKSTLLQQPRLPPTPAPLQDVRPHAPFRLLDLPQDIRNRIYRFTLLPPTRRIHPYLKPWYDETTQNTIPLFLSCKQIHHESELILFGQGIFTAPIRKYQFALLKKLRDDAKLSSLNESLPDTAASLTKRFSSRQIRLIKHVSLDIGLFTKYPLLSYVARVMELDNLELVLEDPVVDEMNRQWRQLAPNKGQWRGSLQDSLLRDVARIPTISVKASGTAVLDALCREWFTHGLRRESLSRTSNDPDMQWLHLARNSMDLYDFYDWDELQGPYRAYRTRFFSPPDRHSRSFPDFNDIDDGDSGNDSD